MKKHFSDVLPDVAARFNNVSGNERETESDQVEGLRANRAVLCWPGTWRRKRRSRCGAAARARRPAGPSRRGRASSCACTRARTVPLRTTHTSKDPVINTTAHSDSVSIQTSGLPSELNRQNSKAIGANYREGD